MSEDELSGAHLEAEEGLKVYELGFHLVSTVPEVELAAEFQKLKDMIVAEKGTFISEEFPKPRTLAYTIVKHQAGRNHRFDRAHFGWIKFIMLPAGLSVLHEKLKQNDKLLRYLLIKTVKEHTLYSGRTFTEKTEPVPIQSPKKIQKEELSATSIAEIDKSIEELVIE